MMLLFAYHSLICARFRACKQGKEKFGAASGSEIVALNVRIVFRQTLDKCYSSHEPQRGYSYKKNIHCQGRTGNRTAFSDFMYE